MVTLIAHLIFLQVCIPICPIPLARPGVLVKSPAARVQERLVAKIDGGLLQKILAIVLINKQ